MGFFTREPGAKPEPRTPGTVLVKATAKGYHVGPREIGDTFEVKPDPKTGEVKASWFKPVKEEVEAKSEPKGKTALTGGDEDLA